MKNKERLVYVNRLEDMLLSIRDTESGPAKILAEYIIELLRNLPTVNAVPVDNIILHHIHIDNNGVPEVKLQFGETFVLLRCDPVNVREVVHGRWEDGVCTSCDFDIRDLIDGESDFRAWVWDGIPYCPNCGAKMTGGE